MAEARTRHGCRGHRAEYVPPAVSTFETPTDYAVAAPRYRLQVTGGQVAEGDEVWLLLSQHIKGKDTPMDDIALHVFTEYNSRSAAAQPYRLDNVSRES